MRLSTQARASIRARRARPDRWLANALAHTGGLLLYQGREADAKRHANEALSIARAVGATEEEILAGGVLGWCLVLEGQLSTSDVSACAMPHALEATPALEGSDQTRLGPRRAR